MEHVVDAPDAKTAVWEKKRKNEKLHFQLGTTLYYSVNTRPWNRSPALNAKWRDNILTRADAERKLSWKFLQQTSFSFNCVISLITAA